MYMDTAGTIAGYFLSGSYSDTAVLSIFSFADTSSPQEAQQVLSDFLEASRNASKTKLIIDVSSNVGGNVYLAFDYLKQVRSSS